MATVHADQRCSTERVIAAFRRAASESPAYRTLLQGNGVSVDAVRDLDTFVRFCPVLNKDNTFNRFPVHDLVTSEALDDVCDVLTSSGHGGRLSFGVITRPQAAAAATFIDEAMDAAFHIKSRKTLAINCLGMGVNVSSHCMTIARVSVREDMAVGLIKKFGRYYAQVLLISDPLFLPLLLAHAEAEGLNWIRHQPKLVIGGEFFGECFRDYVGSRLGYSDPDLDAGVIRSSFGIGELGLHLCYETPTTIALRRYAARHADFATQLLGHRPASGPVPMILTFDGTRTFMEVDHPDSDGYGALTVSLIDPHAPIPLLRYQPGDIVALLNTPEVEAVAAHHGLMLSDVPQNLLALRGRRDEMLPNGCHVGVYREALFANSDVAADLTGAVRIETSAGGMTLHVQMIPGRRAQSSMATTLLGSLASEHRPAQIRFWPYEAFPFGMRLDYERKFRYYEPGTVAGCVSSKQPSGE